MSWAALPNFTTYFGTKLNGSEVTWYNDPSGTSTDKSELKIQWVQNLQSRLYVWYDSSITADSNFFTGTFDIRDNPTTVTKTGTGATETYTGVVDGASVPIGGASAADTVFHMQFTNPVSGASVPYDAFYALATTSVMYDTTTVTGSPPVPGAPPTGSVDWLGGTNPVDLAPTADYEVDGAIFDTAKNDGSGNSCVDDWVLVAATGGPPVTMCTESW